MKVLGVEMVINGKVGQALFLALLLGVAWPGFEGAQAEPVADCDEPVSSVKVLQCVLTNHPELRKARLERTQVSEQGQVARQIPNPELDARIGLFDLSSQEPSRSTEVTLLHTWELGGKRSARVERADSLMHQSEAEIRRLEEEMASRTLLSLHRLTQIEEERETLAETISTFERQIGLLSRRPTLTPEQEVSLSVFHLAKEDAEFKEATLLTEQESFIRTLQLWMGSGASYSKGWLPKEPSEWPLVSDTAAANSDPGGLRKAKAEFGLAQSELSLARSEAWPDLKLGPFLESTADAVGRAYSFGVQLSLRLPVYHQNAGAKAFAQAGVERAQAVTLITRSSLDSERSIAVGQYRRAVEKLRKSRWHQESERRHQKVEELFRRGVVSISLVIEAHRQVLELQKTSHELELRALQSYFAIQTLDGKIPEALK